MFYHAREINLDLNGYSIFANSISLNQAASLSSPYQLDETVNERSVADSAIQNSLQISYWLTGKDPLKNHIFVSHKNPLSGSLAGINFTNAFLESYSLNATPNAPINIVAQLVICDEISGVFSSNSPSLPPSDLKVCNFNDARFSNNSSYSFDALDNITNLNWSFRANIEPVYFYSQSGKDRINPDRVSVGEKTIECSITCDNTNLEMAYTGNNCALDLICYHPTNNSISETYSISGKINRKDFSVSTDNLSQSVYTLTQSHINYLPKIGTLTTSTYPNNNYIIIQSPNLNNGYFTDNNISLVEKVVLGDRELKFNTWRGASFDRITGYIPNDIINGTLQIETTKGLIVYPTLVSLNYSGITISGFYPETGVAHSTINISGSNFFRISQVLFNNAPANFNVYNVTGNTHQMIASVPENASIGQIKVISSLRNISGASTGAFYPNIQITGFTPTGTWSGQCIIAGNNFSGISNVYFNNVRSPAFAVNNNSRITATIPGTGAGYTKGYIKISGFKGMEGISKTIYQPIVRITGINLISGGIDEDIAISGIFDPDFLYQESGGFRLSFGNTYSLFYRQDDYTLTGITPIESFVVAKPALFEPDGIGKYPPFTGEFTQVAAPIIESINYTLAQFPDRILIDQFERRDLILYGKNFNFFFGEPYYVYASGGTANSPDQLYIYDDFERNSAGTILRVNNIRVTGAGKAGGFYRIYVKNAGGVSSQVFYIGASGFPVNYKNGTASMHYTAQISNYFYNIRLPTHAPLAIDENIYSYALTDPFGPDASTNYAAGYLSGWWDYTLDSVVNIGAWRMTQTSIPTNDSIFDTQRLGEYNWANPSSAIDKPILLATTGMLHCYDLGGELLFASGITFDNPTYTILTNQEVVTGVKRIKLFRNDNLNRYMGFSDVRFYD